MKDRKVQTQRQGRWVRAWVRTLLAVILFTGTAGCGSAETLVVEEAETAAGPETAAAEETGLPDTSEDDAGKRICVFVCGAVREPGVYELPEGSRVRDALAAAGGFREDADREYVNLAGPVADGDQIRLPTEEEAAAAGNLTGAADQAGIVNINTADAGELMTLPGIGETRAEEIIRYRTRQGGFASPEEIMNVSGIGEASYEKIRDRITAR